MIRRGFADIAGGQVHYRHAGRGGARPLVMIHASPGSSLMLAPLIEAMAERRAVTAPDTLGNGDSSPAREEAPGIETFATGHLAALDALGVEEFDLYGTHTGASIATEMALTAPHRARRIILDGVGLYSEAQVADMLARYAPAIQPDLHGAHLMWAWHFVRDTYMFWPWYSTDAAHRRPLGLPDAATLHAKVTEVLKALTSYHQSYRAAFGYDKRGRMPQLSMPVLATCARTDMLMPMFEELAAMIPGAERAVTEGIGTPEALAMTASRFHAFLDAG